MPGRSKEDARHQAAFSRHDHQKFEEILHVRSASARRQERASTISRQQLSEHDSREAFHLHNAYASRRRLESDSVQLVGLYSTRLWYKLHRNASSPGKYFQMKNKEKQKQNILSRMRIIF